ALRARDRHHAGNGRSAPSRIRANPRRCGGMTTVSAGQRTESPIADRPNRGSRTRPRIVVLLPRGEAIRNFVYTGVLETLARESEIEVFSVVPSPAVRRLLEGPGGPVTELRPDPPNRALRVLGELVDIAHGRRRRSGGGCVTRRRPPRRRGPRGA